MIADWQSLCNPFALTDSSPQAGLRRADVIIRRVSLISTTSLAKSYGPNDIFAEVSVALPYEARIALVGPNGSGKTTLLRLLAGLEEPSQGTVQRAKGLRLGYLPQEAALEAQGTVWDEMLSAFAALRSREAELNRLEALMADPAQFEAVVDKYGALQHQFELDGGYAYETKIRQVLTGLNFEPADYPKPVKILSGGQKTRALLGRLLLESPDLLVLDEPTNHLDIQAVEWLEDWINEWPGALLIVSHDRYFMDRTVNTLWELRSRRVEAYHGSYSAYLTQRAERHAHRRAEYEAQQAFIAKEEDFIRRNIAGQNTRQAKGRLRRLERLTRESGGLNTAPAGQLVARPDESKAIKLRLDTQLRSGDRVIETFDLGIGYGDDRKVLVRVPDLLLWRGECAALIGPNGAGKTTFLKTLLGGLAPLEGRVRLGSSLRVGYFAQAHEGLQPDRTVVEEVTAVQEMPLGQVRDYLAKFLFTGDDVFKKVAVLSGGERGRVALAKLALTGSNLLLLDEPTNHLDIPSQEILEAVLADFPGTILLVSHDRYLIDALATQIWSVSEGQLEVYQGSWSEYTEWREKVRDEARRKEEEARKVKAPPSAKGAASNLERQQRSLERRRAARLAELEAAVEALEKRRAELTQDIEAAGADVARVRELGREYADVEGELAAKLAEWEAVAKEPGR
jgi:ATP-binding cassette subfamily F protein 3